MSDDLRRFNEKLDRERRETFVEVVEAVHGSIVEGSPVTGAPGQPVDIGTLKGSWIMDFPEEDRALITTHLIYGPPIEDGVGKYGPLTLRSEVGGFHSVKLTRAGFQALVDDVIRRRVA